MHHAVFQISTISSYGAEGRDKQGGANCIDPCLAHKYREKVIFNQTVGFQRFRHMGATVTTSEAVLLQLVGDKDHPKFKEVQALIKISAPESGLVSSL